MQNPHLSELPAPPDGRVGWPWTIGSRCLPSSKSAAESWPLITVVTPSFNQGQFLEEAIRSVLLQGYPNLEYFVLDGGSTDESAEIIKRYSRWIDFWVSERDEGQSAAIMRGLNRGSGLFATWINSDDMLCQDAFFEQATRIGFAANTVYVGKCVYVDVAGNPVGIQRGNVHSLEEHVQIGRIWRAGGQIVQPEVIFPRDLVFAVGGINLQNHHTMDYELWGRLFLAGARFEYTDIPFGISRQHLAQKTVDSLRMTESLLRTAAQLVTEATFLSSERRRQLLAELDAYGKEFLPKAWKNTGRLARLGLPRSIVTTLRKVRADLVKRRKSRE